MPVVKFTASENMLTYHDAPSWKDGDEREVSIDVAKNLVESFSKNFSYVSTEKMQEGPTSNKAVKKPGKLKKLLGSM